MHAAHCDQLIAVERERQAKRYGRSARQRQLWFAFLGAIILYVYGGYRIWKNPPPVSRVWIDKVLVEVIEDSLFATLHGYFLWVVLGLGVAHVLYGMQGGESAAGDAESTSRHPRRPARRAESVARATSLRPSQQQQRTGEDGIFGRAFPSSHPSLPSEASHAHQSDFDAQRPLRTLHELDSFLHREYRQRLKDGLTGVDGTGELGGSGGVRVDARASIFSTRESESLLPDGSIRVSYDVGRKQAGWPRLRFPTSAASTADEAATNTISASADAANQIMWRELEIPYLDVALTQTREWICDVCRRLVEEVDECNRWFANNNIAVFDCAHSLQEVIVTAAPAPTMTGFGAPSPAAVTPAQESKYAALQREKEFVRARQQTVRDLDTVMRYDQRLALEARLDFGSTFPDAFPMAPTERTARQQYILNRLRTFARQRTLSSYISNGGDSESWREGFPCDSHLVLHLLRTSVDHLSTYLRLGYQSTTLQSPDIALCVGDTGEPYFYVRYRGNGDRLFPTRPGKHSLFEALLIFTAIIHKNHHDSFGGLRGTLDLKRADMLRLLAKQQR